MSTAIDSLPHDIEGLRAFALKAIAERDAAIAERDKLQNLYERVHHQLRKAIDHRYGTKSEKLVRLPADQLALALEDIEVAMAKRDAIGEKKQAPLPRLDARLRGHRARARTAPSAGSPRRTRRAGRGG